jgi:hypothetical protein
MTAIRNLQVVQFQANLEDGRAAQDTKEETISGQKQKILQIRDQRMEAVEKNRQAREEQSGATFWGGLIGTVLLGPIGTLLGGGLIGSGIGKSMSNGERDAAEAATRNAGLENIERGKLEDAFEDASESYDDVQQREAQIEKFGRELRRASSEQALV